MSKKFSQVSLLSAQEHDQDQGDNLQQYKVRQNYQTLQNTTNTLNGKADKYLKIQRNMTQSKFNHKLKEIVERIEKEFQKKNSNKNSWMGNTTREKRSNYNTVHDVAERIDNENQRQLKKNHSLGTLRNLATDEKGIIKAQIKYEQKVGKILQAKLENLKARYEEIQMIKGKQSERKVNEGEGKSVKEQQLLTVEAIEGKIKRIQDKRRNLTAQIHSEKKFQWNDFIWKVIKDCQHKINTCSNQADKDIYESKLRLLDLLRVKFSIPRFDIEIAWEEKLRPKTSRA